MKAYYLIPLAALAGLVVGSWGPRDDLARLKEMKESTSRTRKASDAAGFGAFAKMVNIPEVARKPRGQVKKPAKAEKQDAPAQAAKAEGGATPPAKEPKASRALSPEDLRARIDEAAELWRTRVDLAKAQWKSKLGISGDSESEAFDAAISKMNDTLYETMTALAAEIEKAGKVTPELSLRLMGDASTVMAEAYDGIAAIVPPERRAVVSEIPVFEFIDPSVAEPIVGVQDKLELPVRRRRDR